MARGREFDEQVAVDKAMRLFWRKGYDAAPLPDLLREMDLSRSSFYNAFGEKKRVLVDSVRQYMDGGMDGVLLPLFEPDAGRAQIEETFRRMLEHTAGPNGRHGCLVNNCMAEMAAHDAEARKLLVKARAMVEDGFARAAERGQADGTISRTETPRSIGRFLLNTFSGLNVASKGRPSRDVLQDIARMALRILD
ncbi:MAG: TetR/AcrR family transcriptional regulator [Panacagrimonas sp.]